MNDHWMDGYTSSEPSLPRTILVRPPVAPPPAPIPAPANPLGGWKSGQSRRVVDVVCCPTCGAVQVSNHGANSSNPAIDYWECTVCAGRWKEPANLPEVRARALAPAATPAPAAK